MEVWKVIWMAVLILGCAGFIFISGKVIFRGFAEMRDLLRSLK